MDLWDVVKVMWRRWYVTAPLMVAVAVAAGWIGVTVGPDYRATGHVTVVPPAVQRIAEAGQSSPVNPWNQNALAHAATIRLESKQLADQLAGEGFQGEWTVEMSGDLPVITVGVVAPTAEQALSTMHHLQGIVEDEVAYQQATYDIGPGEQFTVVRYDAGESIEVTRSNLVRALAAVAGAGILFATAVVLAVDAVARRRRPAGGAASAATGVAPAVEGTAPVWHAAGSGMAAAAGYPAAAGRVPSGDGWSGNGSAPVAHGREPAAGYASPAPAYLLREEPTRAVPEDPTIVLPPPDPRPVSRRGGGHEHPDRSAGAWVP